MLKTPNKSIDVGGADIDDAFGYFRSRVYMIPFV
jgi:hypothetical protein